MPHTRRLAQLRALHDCMFKAQCNWTLNTSTIRRSEREILALKPHPGGEFVASAGHDFGWLDYDDKKWGRVIYFWNTDSRPILGELVTTHRSPITDFQFSSDGAHVFVASADNLLSQWDFTTKGNVQTFRGHIKSVNSVQRGPYNSLICSGSDDGVTKIWDVRTGYQVHAFYNYGLHPVTSVTFDITGTVVISAAAHRLDIWDMRAPAWVSQLTEHSGLITGTSLSPNGSFLLSNSQDHTLRLWDVRTQSPSNGRCLNVYSGHQHNLQSEFPLLRCAWSPDSYFVSAGSADGVLCVWNCLWSTPIAMIYAHDKPITDVAFHPLRDEVMWGSVDSTIFWQNLSSRRW